MEVNSLKKRIPSRYKDIDVVGLVSKPHTLNPKHSWDSDDSEVTRDPTWSDNNVPLNLIKPRNFDTAKKH